MLLHSLGESSCICAQTRRSLSCVRLAFRFFLGVAMLIQWVLVTHRQRHRPDFLHEEIRSSFYAATSTDKNYEEVDPIQDRITIVVLSDRGSNSTGGPLQGLVHSLLAHTTSPIAFHYISNHRYSWLDDTLHQSPWLLVKRHEVSPLSIKADALSNRTGFRSKHYSARFGMRKLYIPTLDFSIGKENPPSTVLYIDDDMVFYQDVTQLWKVITEQNGSHIPISVTKNATHLANQLIGQLFGSRRPFSFHCPKDGRRVHKNRNQKGIPLNVHPERFAISGLIGFSNLTTNEQRQWYIEVLEQAVHSVTKDYPKVVFGMADQGIFNRVLADHPEYINEIPCEWQCDFQSCFRRNYKRSNAKNGWKCYNCPQVGGNSNKDRQQQDQPCKAFHFLYNSSSTYTPLSNPTLSWNHYASLNTTQLLQDYVQRVAATHVKNRMRG